MPFTVGCVPFLNAKPLVWSFEQSDDSPVLVEYHWPSRLPALLESGSVDAILVSSIDALRVPGRRIAGGCSISSFGPVMSVKVFSNVPFGRITSLALDASSMTSNMLALLVLSRMFGVSPECTNLNPDGSAMLRECDACVLIGDKGLAFAGDGRFSLDLGEAWTNMTGLPFVWACWVGTESLTPYLASLLLAARVEGEANLASVAALAPQEISPQLAHDYLTNAFDYRLEPQMIAGLEMFGRWLVEDGLCSEVFGVTLVGGPAPVAVQSNQVSLA